MTDVGLLLGLVLTVCALLAIAQRRLATGDDAFVQAIEAALPKTQCAQCGYPGCRPYAQALVDGAAIDLCPPGGEATVQHLKKLLPDNPRSAAELAEPAVLIARIDESRCIGCYLCIEACPVDAIVGAPKHMHTVLRDACTGCELCLPPCPVDCIVMERP